MKLLKRFKKYWFRLSYTCLPNRYFLSLFYWIKMINRIRVLPERIKRLIDFKELNLTDREYGIIARKISKTKLKVGMKDLIFFDDDETKNINHAVGVNCTPFNEMKYYPTVYNNFYLTFTLKNKSNLNDQIFLIDADSLTVNVKINKQYNYLVYSHICRVDQNNKNNLDVHYYYHGLTSRTIGIRMNEHSKKDSVFGKYFRDTYNKGLNGLHLFHTHIVVKDGLTKEQAFELEGKCINHHSLLPKGNNLLAGGAVGERAAKTRGYKNRYEAEMDLEEAMNNPDKLNAICAKAYNWIELTDEQIKNMVCHNKNNFSIEEVRFIRIMSLQTENISDICKRIKIQFTNLKNSFIFDRIEGVVKGKTYRFSV